MFSFFLKNKNIPCLMEITQDQNCNICWSIYIYLCFISVEIGPSVFSAICIHLNSDVLKITDLFEVTSILRRRFLTYTDNIEIAKSWIKLLISDQFEIMDSFEAIVVEFFLRQNSILQHWDTSKLTSSANKHIKDGVK